MEDRTQVAVLAWHPDLESITTDDVGTCQPGFEQDQTFEEGQSGNCPEGDEERLPLIPLWTVAVQP